MSQKRDTKSLKQEPTIQLSDTPYQGFYAAITAELLILKLHFALKTSSNSQPADPSSTKPQHSWSRGICASSRRAQELQLHLVWQWQEDPDALTQQWDPQLAPEERVDLLELAAQHLLLLWGWNAARGWLQAKKKKIQGNSIHSLQPQLMELFMSWDPSEYVILEGLLGKLKLGNCSPWKVDEWEEHSWLKAGTSTGKWSPENKEAPGDSAIWQPHLAAKEGFSKSLGCGERI